MCSFVVSQQLNLLIKIIYNVKCNVITVVLPFSNCRRSLRCSLKSYKLVLLLYFDTHGDQSSSQRLHQNPGVFLTADAPKCVVEQATQQHSLPLNSQSSTKPCELSLQSYYSPVQCSVSSLRTAHSSSLNIKGIYRKVDYTAGRRVQLT
jgi:hypothetical protein